MLLVGNRGKFEVNFFFKKESMMTSWMRPF